MTEQPGIPDPDVIVGEHWPYDGPHTPERIAAALAAVAELVRYSNNATQHPTNVGYAPQAYRTLGGVSAAAGDLPQLCGQLASWADELTADSTVRHDAWRAEPSVSHQVAQETATEVATALRQAAATARQLHEALAAARQPLSHLYHDVDEHAEE